ncbi:acyl-CoA dehydrogenase family protein, partial [Mycobacterium talmoniae]|uniref:acyl-CoA dehydrogenase family protein n=1 Tax=Mycobacterium talmoniae TaxID=1858794 RepID=UPI000AADF046
MSDERELLRQTVAALVDKHAGPEAVRAAMESERGYDGSLWQLLCEQVGAAALVVPERFGGAGGELADAAVVLEELGKALVPTPLLGTTLAELALLAAAEPDTEALERLAEGAALGAVVFDPEYVINGDAAVIAVHAGGTRVTGGAPAAVIELCSGRRALRGRARWGGGWGGLWCVGLCC